MKKLITLRVAEQTESQIVDLTRWLGFTRTEVLLLAVDRLHRDTEKRRANDTQEPRPLHEYSDAELKQLIAAVREREPEDMKEE